MHKPRVLFVLRKRQPTPGPGPYGGCGPDQPNGMSVSVQILVDILQEIGCDAKAVYVSDNNFIHQEVEAYKPTHCIIEGFWVVPDKFVLLQAMHPDVHWVIRCHSNTEFLAHEGTVFGWALDYLDRGVTVGFNSRRAEREVRNLYYSRPGCRHEPKTVYLPNCYTLQDLKSLPMHWLSKLWIKRSQVKQHGEFQVGCFGAVRPLKNQMNQAIAAIELAQRMGLKLKFYINDESGNDRALVDSLRSLFKRVAPHELVEVPWQQHDDFLRTLTKMDLVTQVSNSETFNIVLADAVSVGVPVIGANIPWLDDEYQPDPNNVEQIARVMHHTWLRSGNEGVQQDQRRSLVTYVKRAVLDWERWLVS